MQGPGGIGAFARRKVSAMISARPVKSHESVE